MKSVSKYISSYPIECAVIFVLFCFSLFTIGSQFRLLNHVVFSLVIVLILLQTSRSLADNDKKARIYYFTIFVLLASPISIYAIILVIGYFKPSLIQVANASDWIGFAGSIIGGSMTMFAVIFSLQHTSELYEKQVIDSQKPRVSLSPTYSEDSMRIIRIIESDSKYDFIDIEVHNYSNNPLLNFRIMDIERIDKGMSIGEDFIINEKAFDENTMFELSEASVIREKSRHSFPIYFDTSNIQNIERDIIRMVVFKIKICFQDISYKNYEQLYLLCIQMSNYKSNGKDYRSYTRIVSRDII